MRLASMVIRARKKAGLNPHQLADASCLNSATIYNIESGRQPSVTRATAMKLAAVLDVTAAELMGV